MTRISFLKADPSLMIFSVIAKSLSFEKKNIFTFFAMTSWSRDFLAIRNEVSSHLRYLYEGESQSVEKTNNRQKSR